MVVGGECWQPHLSMVIHHEDRCLERMVDNEPMLHLHGGFPTLSCDEVCCGPNASAQARWTAGERHERTLFAVACSALFEMGTQTPCKWDVSFSLAMVRSPQRFLVNSVMLQQSKV